jgi:hypothetical protein
VYKKVFILSVVIASLNAGMFSSVSGFAMKEVKPEHAYTLDTAGINPRVYEFVPKGDSSKLCVVVFGNPGDRCDVNIQVMQCFERKKEK